MSRQFNYLFAGAAFALCASVGALAYAQPAAKSQTEVRTTHDGETHVVRVIRDASGQVTVERDGKTTMVHADGAHHADRAQHLRAVLQLRPNQEAALAAYLAALHPQHDVMYRTDDHDGAQTTPQRLAEMEKMLVEHDARVKAHIGATRAFYDQLDAAQKKAFDELEMAGDHMGMMQQVRFMHPMGPMPPMPPMPSMRVPPGL